MTQPTTTLPLRIMLEGAFNVRDLGGYPTVAGRRTRQGIFYRADSLHRLTAADQQALLTLGLKTVIDLRNAVELKLSPNVFTEVEQVSYHNFPLLTPPPGMAPADTAAAIPTSLPMLFRIILDFAQVQLKQVFNIIADDSTAPVIFHCTAGKDRTGVVTALMLDLAGVDHPTIAQDFASTAAFIAPLLDTFRQNLPPGMTVEQLNVLLGAAPEDMLETLAYLYQNYGGSASYLSHIGLTPAQIDSLRNRLVE